MTDQQEPFYDKPENEETVKKQIFKINKSRPNIKPPEMRLVKQQVLTEIVSVWEIDGQYIEVTQTSRGKYLLYKLSPREFKEWDNHDNVHGLGDGTKVGKKCKVIQGEWWLDIED